MQTSSPGQRWTYRVALDVSAACAATVVLAASGDPYPHFRSGTRKVRCLLALAWMISLLCTVAAQAAIPAAERQVLLDFYNDTGGSGWTNHTNWGGPVGGECYWFGITCDGVETSITRHVIYLNFVQNNLVGTLPTFSGLTNLQVIHVDGNHLTGTIPPFAGLPNLTEFQAARNQLSGPLPSHAELSNIDLFSVWNNQLTGTIPSLDGLTRLSVFYVDNNQLTGALPSLSGLQLVGFGAGGNHLTGTISSLAAATNLYDFFVNDNQLTGSLPALIGHPSLAQFRADGNKLTGSIPSLDGLTNLTYFRVGGNQLSGPLPAVPAPNSLEPGSSSLCPNRLDLTNSTDWDAATGVTPWYGDCVQIFRDGFDGI